MKMLIKNIVRKTHIAYLRTKASHRPEIEPFGRVLIVAPHPDDEVIGCGGLITRLVGEGRVPYIVVMTGGEGSHRGCCNLTADAITEARRGLTLDALSILGVPRENIYELTYPDGGIILENTHTEQLRKLIDQLQPQTVFVPHWGEGWPDHVKTAEIVKGIVPTTTAIYEYCVWMWYYNVWQGLDWMNAAVLKMAPEEHNLKLRSMDAYIKPLAPCGQPWSGVLPALFIKANHWNKELYFKV